MFMKQIELTRNIYTLVDDEDYDLVSQYKWQATWDGYHWYAVTGPNKKTTNKLLRMHRLIMNAQPGQEVDHKFHYEDYVDNQKINLRLCTRTENNWNRRKYFAHVGKSTSSQYKGVSWHRQRQKWQAQINENKKLVYIGLFSNETEAARAYNAMAIKHFGEFALLNDV